MGRFTLLKIIDKMGKCGFGSRISKLENNSNVGIIANHPRDYEST